MQIDPDVVIVKDKGGAEIHRNIALANNADAALRFSIQPEYWVRPAGMPDLSGWMKIRPESMDIPANGRQQLKVDFRLPAVLQGECLVMVFFASEAAGADIKILPRFGIPVYICRQNTERVKAAVQAFAAKAADQPPVFELQVRNEGNVHVIPFGNVRVTDHTGKLVYLKEFRYPEPIFSGQVGRLEITGNPVPKGGYRADAVIYLDNLYAASANVRQKLSADCGFIYP